MQANILKNNHIVCHFEVIDNNGGTWVYRLYKDDHHTSANVSPIGLISTITVPKAVNRFALKFYKQHQLEAVAS